MNNANIRTSLSVKKKTVATLIAIAAAVIIPQICHILGAVSGLGTAVGEIFLPMHLPILFVGLVAGSVPGMLAGAIAPVVSTLLTGMPKTAVLPFMMIELCVYGFVCGLLRNMKMPVILKVLIAQIAGRTVRAAAIAVSYYYVGVTTVSPASVITAVTTGVFGILLQLIIIPLAVRAFGFDK